MADCQSQRLEVERLQELLDKQTMDCQQINNPFEKLLCLQLRIVIVAQLSRAHSALENCERGLPPPGIHRTTGRISFLRVHDTGGFGPTWDHLDGEVVFKLDTHPNRAFGFELREDATRPAHEGMLDLLRDALANDFDVTIEYRQVLNQANSVAFRIELTKTDGGPKVDLLSVFMRR